MSVFSAARGHVRYRRPGPQLLASGLVRCRLGRQKTSVRDRRPAPLTTSARDRRRLGRRKTSARDLHLGSQHALPGGPSARLRRCRRARRRRIAFAPPFDASFVSVGCF